MKDEIAGPNARLRGKQSPQIERSIRLSARNMSTDQAGITTRHIKHLFDSEAIYP